MVFCGKCGTKNPDDNLYCRQCGARISQSIPTESEPVPEPEPKRTEEPVETRVIEVSDDVDEKPLSSMTPAERRRLSSKTDADPPGTGADKAMMVLGGLLMAVAVAYLMFMKQVDWNMIVMGETVDTESGTMWDIMTGSSTPGFSAVFIIAMIGMVMSVASPVFSVFGLIGTVGCYMMAGDGVVLDLGKEFGGAFTLQMGESGPLFIAAIICLSLTFIGIWGYVSLAKATGRWDPIALTWRSIV